MRQESSNLQESVIISAASLDDEDAEKAKGGSHAISASKIQSFVPLLKWLITLCGFPKAFKSQESCGFLAISCHAKKIDHRLARKRRQGD